MLPCLPRSRKRGTLHGGEAAHPKSASCNHFTRRPFFFLSRMKISGLRPGLLFGAIVLLWSVYNPEPALAHGFAGDRFFPATISTDDPFAASELSLPTISYSRQPGSRPTKTINFSSDISLLVLPSVTATLGYRFQCQ